jgi:PAS domain S-box-containing protein
MIASLIVTAMALIIIEYHAPWLIRGYDAVFDRYGDVGFGLLINIVANTALLSVITDQYINEQTKARFYEAEIERQKIDLLNEQFIRVFNASPGVKSIRRINDWRYIAVNDSWVNFFGYQREEVIGKTALELNLHSNSEKTQEARKSLDETGFVQETQMRTKGGELRDVVRSNVRIDFNGEPCALYTLTDVTALKNYERKLAHLDRLNLVGEMAASLGHEIRNPLTTVRGFLQVFEKRAASAADKDNFALMIAELDRANAIISEFLSLAKNRVINLKPSKLNQIIDNLYPLMCAAAVSEGVGLLLMLENIPEIMADADEIRQLVLNLVRNATEAMGEGGQIILATRLEGKTVVLSVKDTGHGIPPKIFERLGTPFLTTKEKGTGLGLPICYRIAERHNAKVLVDTGANGTKFSFRFPVIPADH